MGSAVEGTAPAMIDGLTGRVGIDIARFDLTVFISNQKEAKPRVRVHVPPGREDFNAAR